MHNPTNPLAVAAEILGELAAETEESMSVGRSWMEGPLTKSERKDAERQMREIEATLDRILPSLTMLERLAAINVESFTATYRHEPGLSFRTPEMVAVDHREDYSGSWAGVCDSDSHRERYGVDGDSPKMAEHRALCLLLAAAEARRLNGGATDV